MKYTVKSEISRSVEIQRTATLSDTFSITVDDTPFDVEIKETYPNGAIKTLLINNQLLPVEVLTHADGFPRSIQLNGLPFDVEIEKIKTIRQSQKSVEKVICGDVKSNLPGLIISVLVQEGEMVQKDQPLVILESMKMENEILSPKEGQVKNTLVSVGQVVKKDELLLQIN